MKHRPLFDAIVIGAGAAGLTAARDLSHAGLTIALLEARGRIGGRMHTIHDPQLPVPVELGAEFLHGAAGDTMRIVQAAGLGVIDLPDDHLMSRAGRFGAIGDFWETVEKISRDIKRRLARVDARDFPLSEYLERVKLPSDKRQLLIDFVEGYHAAHVDRMSAQSMVSGDQEGTDDGGADRQGRLAAGYDSVARWLFAGLDPARTQVRLNTVAVELEWKRGEVIARCRTGTGAELAPFRAHAAVVAIPHAVLRAGLLRFRPEVPGKQHAIERLEAGQVFKILLRFRERFWDEEGFMKKRLAEPREHPAALNFVHAHGAEVPTWWTMRPVLVPVLTGWAGGPRAEALLARGEMDRVDRSLDALSDAIAVPRRVLDEQLEAWTMHDWQADPWSRGAYSYAAVGGMAAQRQLGKPANGTLFFAGEHTAVDETGTVSGAIASGHRAARQVLGVRGQGLGPRQTFLALGTSKRYRRSQVPSP